MKIIKIIFFIPIYIIKMFIKGFKVLSLFLSRGFYFYLEKLFTWIEKLIPLKLNRKLIERFQNLKEEPSHIVMVIIWFLCALYIFDTLHVDTSNYIQTLSYKGVKPVVKESKKDKKSKKENVLLSKELNLYRIYGKYSLDEIDFSTLKKTNSDTIAWITVEGTTINYPIVQASDNDYYLNHSYDKAYSVGGWTFMDYRNNRMKDKNTIFYGHNLINNTAFGSMSKLFSSKRKDIKILVLTDEGKTYTYQVFSGYTVKPEVYYLQTEFYSNDEYQKFLKTLSSRNTLSVNVPVTTNDNIITLSTCTDDNKGRRVIHSKLISTE